jgi:hypothetical protein
LDLKVWKAEPMPDNPEGPALRLVAWPHYDEHRPGIESESRPTQPEGLIAPWDRTGSTTQ